MEIVLAKNAGFCFGVKRAIEKVKSLLDNSKKHIYSIGSLIHNELVIRNLKAKGLIELNDENEILKLKDEIVIVRTHGIEKGLYEHLKLSGNEIIDLTCPFVRKIHNIVEEHSKNGYKVIVIGDKDHPEVKGIISYGKEVHVMLKEDHIKSLKIPKDSPILIVFQTTTNVINAQKLVDILRNIYYNSKVVNTICNTTIERQEEIKSLAKVCDVVLIIGSQNSSNTVKLYDNAKEFCFNSHIIESSEDLKKIKINTNAKVGVSAGASTPQYLIEEILGNVRNEF